jgi:hypothetical protein
MRVEVLLHTGVTVVALSLLVTAMLCVVVALCCTRSRDADGDEDGRNNDEELYESSTDDGGDGANKNVRGGVLYDEEGNRREFGEREASKAFHRVLSSDYYYVL